MIDIEKFTDMAKTNQNPAINIGCQDKFEIITIHLKNNKKQQNDQKLNIEM